MKKKIQQSISELVVDPDMVYNILLFYLFIKMIHLRLRFVLFEVCAFLSPNQIFIFSTFLGPKMSILLCVSEANEGQETRWFSVSILPLRYSLFFLHHF